MILEKAPPHSTEMEMAVLGSMMLDKEACEVALESLKPGDFFEARNEIVFRAIADLYQRNKGISVISVAEELRAKSKLVAIGGAEHLADSVNSTATPAHIPWYIEHVKNYSTLRSLIRSCSEVIQDCYENGEEPKEILEKAEKQLYAISDGGGSNIQAMSEFLHESVELIEKLQKKELPAAGVTTGYPSLDKITSGFQPGNLIILAARPGVGKTAAAIDVILHNTIKKSSPSVFFSLEMSKQEITNRMLSSLSGIGLFSIRNGFFSDDRWPDIVKAQEALYNAPLYMDCTSFNLSPMSIRSSARRLATKLARDGKPLSLVVVDYLQLMASSTKRYENRQAEVADISRSMKALAMDLKIPVIALSQLNRNTEERGGDGRPRLADLRDSGAIEQDADMVLFLWREKMYKPDATDEERAETKLIIAKHRNGPLGEINMKFIKEQTKFVEVVE